MFLDCEKTEHCMMSVLPVLVGSTWVQEVVYLLNNNMDEKKARKQNMEDRFPQLEYTYPGLAALEAAEGPRLLKTHLPFEMLPKSIKEEGKTKVGVKYRVELSMTKMPFYKCIAYYLLVKGTQSDCFLFL